MAYCGINKTTAHAILHHFVVPYIACGRSHGETYIHTAILERAYGAVSTRPLSLENITLNISIFA